MPQIKYTLLALAISLGTNPLAVAKQSTNYVQLPTTQATSAAYDDSYSIFQPVIAQEGIVATEELHATQAGIQALQNGGNVIDAAVTIGFTLAVTLPNAGNIGGGGFMLYHDAQDNQTYALDFREIAPQGANKDTFLDSAGDVIDGRSLYSHYAVGVPGTVAGLVYAHEQWGQLPLEELLQPAIQLAEDGFDVSHTLANALERTAERMEPWSATTDIFWHDGRPLQAGERLVQKDLAQSLQLIAQDGAQAFYQGSIAEAIATEMQEHPGAITLEDLQNYAVALREPLTGEYRDHTIATMPPPSSGGVHLLQILNIAEQWPLSDWGHNSADMVHHLSEAMKYAYADRSVYLGDPDYFDVPVKGLTNKAYAHDIADKIDNQATPAEAIQEGNPHDYEGDQTTHYSILDDAGNAVSVTYTLNTNFGSGIVVPGTGILLNNEMDDFALKPGVANAYGLIGGEANAVEAGKRPLSSMTPTMVFKDGTPILVTGSPGGARIITTVLQTVLNAIDYEMNPAQNAASPRFHHQWLPDELRLEQGFSPDTVHLLEERGHNISVKPAMGRTQTVQQRNDALQGYSDPRNPDGRTLGF
ncbi:MAG TPA: gamma-glutamyltransferase [Paenalcaligenes sp.]|nr:gamma-glutamyltransferase [Paenalcaligenes sp.]